MNRKNILHVVTVSFSIPIFFRNQFKYFEKRQNTFVACKDSLQFRELSLSYSFSPIKINIGREISPLKDLICIIVLYRQIKKNNIDIVVGHTPKAALLAMIASYFSRTKKRIYFKHGLLFETQIGFKKTLFIIIEKITEYFSTEVICVSDSLIKKSIKYKLGNPNRYKLLNNGTCNGVDAIRQFNKSRIFEKDITNLKSNLKINNNIFIVGFVGRIANDKGINELLDAWKIITSKYTDMLLLIIGPLDERDPVNLVKLNSLSQIIRIDFVLYPEIYYSIMDIFILPSYREGFPTVNLEAASMNLPVITTKKTGCVDSIIPNNTGIFTDIDPISISESIIFYYQNRNLIQQHGDAGRRYVIQNFNQEDVWKSLSNILFHE